MKNEPGGAIAVAHKRNTNLKRTAAASAQARNTSTTIELFSSLPHPIGQSANTDTPIFASVEAMTHAMLPAEPVQVLRPHIITRMAQFFLESFPGDVLYAVKTNPDVRVLKTLHAAGVRHFDVASLNEVQVAFDHCPDSTLYFMHPVKSREAIARAYYQYGVRHFSLDSHDELEKILTVTGQAEDLNLFVRLSIPNDKAAYSLSGKFGVSLENAASLLMATRKAARKLGVCFHVGSQCMDPEAYNVTMGYVRDLLTQVDVKLDALDIGGGFPSVYPGMTPPSLVSYMDTIRQGLANFNLPEGCQVLCEPGRALVAEAGSVVVRVELRKGQMLHINDGTFGTLFDAGTPGFVFPAKAIRLGGEFSEVLAPFGFFGPTCDSMDTMNGPFMLPADMQEGDWIEIGQLGAYGATMRTRFNGFYSDATAEVLDEPLMSIMGVN